MSRLSSIVPLVLVVCLAGGLLSCVSRPLALAEVQEPVAAPEPKPEPAAPVAQAAPQPAAATTAPQPAPQTASQPAAQPAPQQQAKPEEPPIPPITGTIVEVGSSAGRQTTIYVRGLSSLKGLRTGLKGYIFADRGGTNRIGKFVLTDLFGNGAGKGTILNTETTIVEGAMIQIEIDPKNLIE